MENSCSLLDEPSIIIFAFLSPLSRAKRCLRCHTKPTWKICVNQKKRHRVLFSGSLNLQRPNSPFQSQHRLNCSFMFDLSRPLPSFPFTEQPPKYPRKCKAGISAAVIVVGVCREEEMGKKVVIGLSHKIYSSWLYRDLLDWEVH